MDGPAELLEVNLWEPAYMWDAVKEKWVADKEDKGEFSKETFKYNLLPGQPHEVNGLLRAPDLATLRNTPIMTKLRSTNSRGRKESLTKLYDVEFPVRNSLGQPLIDNGDPVMTTAKKVLSHKYTDQNKRYDLFKRLMGGVEYSSWGAFIAESASSNWNKNKRGGGQTVPNYFTPDDKLVANGITVDGKKFHRRRNNFMRATHIQELEVFQMQLAMAEDPFPLKDQLLAFVPQLLKPHEGQQPPFICYQVLGRLVALDMQRKKQQSDRSNRLVKAVLEGQKRTATKDRDDDDVDNDVIDFFSEDDGTVERSLTAAAKIQSWVRVCQAKQQLLALRNAKPKSTPSRTQSTNTNSTVESESNGTADVDNGDFMEAGKDNDNGIGDRDSISGDDKDKTLKNDAKTNASYAEETGSDASELGDETVLEEGLQQQLIQQQLIQQQLIQQQLNEFLALAEDLEMEDW